MKIEIKVIETRKWGESARIEVHAEGQKIATGHVGGEPEDNTIDRDYSWIVPALEGLAKKCGAEVEIVESSEVS